VRPRTPVRPADRCPPGPVAGVGPPADHSDRNHQAVAAGRRARSGAQPCAQRSTMIPVTCAGICRGKRRRPRPPKTEQPLRFTGGTGTGGRCSDPRLRASHMKSSPESRRPREKRRRSEARQARARPTHNGGCRADLVTHTLLAPRRGRAPQRRPGHREKGSHASTTPANGRRVGWWPVGAAPRTPDQSATSVRTGRHGAPEASSGRRGATAAGLELKGRPEERLRPQGRAYHEQVCYFDMWVLVVWARRVIRMHGCWTAGQAIIIIFPLVVCDKAKGTMKLHLEV